VSLYLGAGPALAVEREEDEPEHVERRHEGGDDADDPDEIVAAAEGATQDLVLREEASQREHAGVGKGTDHHRPVGHFQLPTQAAHLAHVLLAAHGVDHRARAEEQQALEEAVGEQVEDAGRPRTRAQGHEHVAELADGAVGDHALDVGLRDRDARRVDRREGTDAHHHQHGGVRVDEKWVGAGDHVHASVDHGRRVNQRADRRGAFHGVGQPHVQRKLGTLTHGAGEQQQANAEHGRAADAGGLGEDRRELQTAKREEHEQHAERKAEVAHAVHQKGLLASLRGCLAREPEGDQQVGAEAHALPGEEHEQVVVRQHQDEHREHEQVEVGEEAVVALVAVHVTDRVVVHDHADRAHHEQHDGRQRVDVETPGDVEAARGDPRESVPIEDRVLVREDMHEQVHAEDPGEGDRGQADHIGTATHEALAEEQRNHEAGERQYGH
jgi:hypothetical protein